MEITAFAFSNQDSMQDAFMIFSGVHFSNWSDKTHTYSPVGNGIQQSVSQALPEGHVLAGYIDTYIYGFTYFFT